MHSLQYCLCYAVDIIAKVVDDMHESSCGPFATDRYYFLTPFRLYVYLLPYFIHCPQRSFAGVLSLTWSDIKK